MYHRGVPVADGAVGGPNRRAGAAIPPAPGIAAAAVVPVRAGPAPGLLAQFNIRTAAPPTWLGSLCSSESPGWGQLLTIEERFTVALLINTTKAQIIPRNERPSIYENQERIRLVSYVEAIFDAAAPIIANTRPAPLVLPAPGTLPWTVRAAAAGATTWDDLASEQSGAPTTFAAALAIWTAPAHLAAINQRFIDSQFTFLLAVAKKGDMTQAFGQKALRGLQQELGLNNLQLYDQEVSWICQRLLSSETLQGEAEWAAFFAAITAAAANVERVRTVVAWAREAGLTKLHFLRQAYNTYPTFDWQAVHAAFPGEFEIAIDTAATAAAQPYRGFYAPQAAPNWNPYGFANIAHVAQILLAACGNTAAANYRGFQNHHLQGRALWTQVAQTYAMNHAGAQVPVFDATAQNILTLPNLDRF